MHILGIHPGINGGLAVVEIDNGAAPQLVAAIDIPTVGTGETAKKILERSDVEALGDGLFAGLSRSFRWRGNAP